MKYIIQWNGSTMIFVGKQIDWNYVDYEPEYRKFSSEDDPIFFKRGWERNMIIHFANLQNTDVICDIGGGRSFFTPFISKWIRRGYIVDIGVSDEFGGFETWYKTYHKLDKFIDGTIVVLRDNAMKLPLKDGYIDKAVTISVLEHVDFVTGDDNADSDIVKEIYRVLKPGGLFLGTVDFCPTTERPWGEGGGRVYTYDSFEKRILAATNFKLLGEYNRLETTDRPNDIQPLFFILVKP